MQGSWRVGGGREAQEQTGGGGGLGGAGAGQPPAQSRPAGRPMAAVLLLAASRHRASSRGVPRA